MIEKKEKHKIVEGNVILDGITIQLTKPDINNDGRTDIEYLEKQYESKYATSINPTAEGDMLRELNRDEIDNISRMSSFDMKANLHSIDMDSIANFDGLISNGFLPVDQSVITRKRLRLSVSVNALGRQNAVDIITGQRNFNKESGNKFMNFFKPQRNKLGKEDKTVNG